MDTPTHAAGTALARKRTDTELMPPPPRAKRIVRPKTVLDEDTYADGLSKIIARDFFPGLVESETQNEYLNALDSKDPAWIASAGRRLREVMTLGGRSERRASSSFRLATPAGTPRGYAGDTPASVASSSATVADKDGGPKGAASAVRTNVSLGGFQAQYTSEDNESFYRLLDRQNQKRAEAHAWLWNGNKLPSKMQLQQKAVGDRLRAAGRALEDDGFARDRLAIADRAADRRPAAPDTWKHTAKSALMFHPDGDAGGGSRAAAEETAAASSSASTAAPKSIVYANTRLLTAQKQQQQQQQQQQSHAVPPSPTLSAVRDAIAGKPRAADADSTAAGSVAGGGGETPRVNGYAFVADEDDDDGATAEGAFDDSAALAFGPVDATPNPFQLQDKSRREGLHHRMVERIAQSKRTSARVGLTGRVPPQTAPHTPLLHTPRSVRGGGSSGSGSGGLTPAGQRLWDKIGGGVLRRNDAVTAFNRQPGRGPANGGRGSRRARLRQLRER